MAVFRQSFATEAALTISGFSTLTGGGTATSDEVDNSTNLYDEIILELKVGGTAITTSWLDVRILASIDGGGAGDWSSWKTPYLILPAIDMSTDNPVYHARFVPPQRWKVSILNNTGATLDVGSGSFQGITYTGA